VFDLFGAVPHTALLHYLGKENLKYSDERIQTSEGVACGHLCVMVLKMLFDKVELKKVLLLISASRYIWGQFVEIVG
jgi:predicted HD phosphohydrolase